MLGLCVATLCFAWYVISNSIPTPDLTQLTGGQHEITLDAERLIQAIRNWAEELPVDERGGPPAVPPGFELSEDDRTQILNAIVCDLLESPDLQQSRDFYGTPGRRSAVIITDSEAALPETFEAHVPEWEIGYRDGSDEPDADSPRVLGIRFDRFAPEEPAELMGSHVSACLFNGGGNPDGTIHIGGQLSFYQVSRSNDEWTVSRTYSFDP